MGCRDRPSRVRDGTCVGNWHNSPVIANSNDPNPGRQGVRDRATLTRGEVARYLGKHVSWVRRREGSLLHPSLENGVNLFDASEVDALRERLTAETAASSADSALLSEVHDMFVRHTELGEEFTIEGIARRAGLQAEGVRRLHKSWAAERRSMGSAARPLLSQGKLAELVRQEVVAINREYDQRIAQYEADDVAWRREVDERRREMERDWLAEEQAREADRQRRAEKRAAALRETRAVRSHASLEVPATRELNRSDVPEFMQLLCAILGVARK